MEPLGISQGYRLANSLYSPPPFLIHTGMKVSPITCWRTIPSRLSSKVKRVVLFKDCALDYHIQNHMKAKDGVDRNRYFSHGARPASPYINRDR